MELASKIAAAYLFIPLWGYLGACIAEPLSWTFSVQFICCLYLKRNLKGLTGLPKSKSRKKI